MYTRVTITKEVATGDLTSVKATSH